MGRAVGDTSQCRNGHPRTPEDTYSYVTKTGNKGSACRVCRRAAVSRRDAKDRSRGRPRGRKFARTQRGRYSTLKKNAKRRSLEFALSLADYAAIAAGSCTYCNGHLPETGGGVDRKNSTVGYTVDNCVACCSTCNTIRMDDLISYEEMFHVMRLLKSLREEALLGP